MTPKPLTIVVFGATGDLFVRKLGFALFDLFRKGLLPERTKIVGFSRKPFSDDDYREFTRATILSRPGTKEEELTAFLSRMRYHQGDLGDEKSYASLGKFLEGEDHAHGVCSDKIFYLAIPPNLYEQVFTRLSKSGLAIPCAPGVPNGENAWTRVLVEKPFGNNETEAARLDELLGKLFEEEQIFRIDHYLAKETIQNIISFRFSNGIFEPLWNKKHIEHVEIKFLGTEGVDARGAFYDAVGALRDVGQNHILQMLSLIAMENPEELKAEHIREARRMVLSRVSLAGKISHAVTRAQYEGYRSERGVAPDSRTETYFKLALRVKNSRWRGVPFFVESGKAMHESEVSISVFFKPTPCVCPEEHTQAHQNVLTFHISPREEISLLFWAKRSGFEFGLEPRELSFSFKEGALQHEIPNAYERVLYDCIRGDQTLFASTAEVKQQWKIITPILEKWSSLPLPVYAKGGNGPIV